MDRLDVYEQLPSGMREYLSTYGWSFSNKLAKHAVSKMKNKQEKHFTPEKVMEILQLNGVKINEEDLNDAYYLFNYFYSDHFGTTLKTEADVASMVNDYFQDLDGYKGMALTRYFADCIGKGKPLLWEKYL